MPEKSSAAFGVADAAASGGAWPRRKAAEIPRQSAKAVRRMETSLESSQDCMRDPQGVDRSMFHGSVNEGKAFPLNGFPRSGPGPLWPAPQTPTRSRCGTRPCGIRTPLLPGSVDEPELVGRTRMRSFMRSGSSLLLAFLAAATPATKPASKAATPKSAAAPGKPVKVTSVEGITEYRLSNGLTVLLFPD